MRHLIILAALLIGTVSFGQQTKNTKTETVTTKKTITDNQGSRIQTKNESQTKDSKIRLDEAEANKVNQTAIVEPEEISTDVSYDFEGNQFQFSNREDQSGYRLMQVKGNNDEGPSILSPASREGHYIITKDDTTAMGYFNEEGDFVVERYDPEQDKVVVDVYELNKKSAEDNKQ